MASTIYLGDIGTEIILNCGSDISAGTLFQIKVTTPAGKPRVWSATLEGTTSVKHIVQAGDIDAPGAWVLQAYVEMPSWKGRGAPVTLTVEK